MNVGAKTRHSSGAIKASPCSPILLHHFAGSFLHHLPGLAQNEFQYFNNFWVDGLKCWYGVALHVTFYMKYLNSGTVHFASLSTVDWKLFLGRQSYKIVSKVFNTWFRIQEATALLKVKKWWQKNLLIQFAADTTSNENWGNSQNNSEILGSRQQDQKSFLEKVNYYQLSGGKDSNCWK